MRSLHARPFAWLDITLWWPWSWGVDRGLYWTFVDIGPLMIGWPNRRQR